MLRVFCARCEVYNVRIDLFGFKKEKLFKLADLTFDLHS